MKTKIVNVLAADARPTPELSIDRLSAVLDRALQLAESHPEAAQALAAIVQASAINDLAGRLKSLAEWTALVKSVPIARLTEMPLREPLALLVQTVENLDNHGENNHGHNGGNE